MTHRQRATDGEPKLERSEALDRSQPSTSRRAVLKAIGVGASAVAVGGPVVGSAQSSDRQIPTPWLHVDGNLVKDPLGSVVKLRGLNIADPKRIDTTAPARGMTAPQVIDFLTDPDRGWYPRLIRIPVQPIDVGEHAPGHVGGPPAAPAFTRAQLEEYIENHLDPVVRRCRERGVYCIVDYHRHWGDGEFEWNQPDLADEVDMFWDTVAPHYADQSHVLFEVYNEPTEPGMWTTLDNDADVWLEWKATAQPWVDTIRSHAPHNLILIGSPSWTQNPEGVFVEPFDGENLAYTYHIYPGHTVSKRAAWGGDHTEAMQNAYEEVPVFVTEFGWQNDIRDDYLQGTTSEFGEPFVEFLESSDGLHWTAWCGDPIWRPVMFSRSPFTDAGHEDDEDSIGHPYQDDIPEYCPELPCEWALLGRDEGDYDDFSGGFIQDVLAETRDDKVPTVEFDDRPPGVPEPTVEAVTQTTVDLVWEPVANPGDSPFSHYTVYLDGEKHVEVPGDRTSVTLEDLLADETYVIGVTAADGSGNESAAGTVSVTTVPFDDDTPPAVPQNLTSPDRTHLTIDLQWEGVTDTGPAGLHHYNVYVDGTVDHTVPVGTTSTILTELTPDTTYVIAVSAVDYAKNESDRSVSIAVTTEVDRPGPGDLVINDYDGDPPWPEANDLGNWIGGDAFESMGVTDDATLRFEYDDSGWYGTAVAQDVSRYSSLNVRVRGDDGGEEEHVDIAFAGIDGVISAVTGDEIGQEMSLVSLDLTEVPASELEDPGQLRLGFDNGGTGAIEVDVIWLSADDGVDRPAPPEDLSSPDRTTTSVDLTWSASTDAVSYAVYVDGVADHTVEATSTTVDGLSPGTTYVVGVAAVDDAGTESDRETLVVGTAVDGEGIPVGEYTARDPNGDGLYTDVNGNGGNDFDDVVTFFQEMDDEGVQNNVSAFDFNGNGGIDFDDVVALFEQL